MGGVVMKQAAPEALPRDDWNLVIGGDVGIGPGSYYMDDETITITKQLSIFSESDIWTIIDQYESDFTNGGYNPIVILERPVGESVTIRAHRFKFMFQHLDANTGDTPMQFNAANRAVLMKQLDKHDKRREARVYVRSDKWWSNNKNSIDKRILFLLPVASTTQSET
jgi:hypothetical protein